MERKICHQMAPARKLNQKQICDLLWIIPFPPEAEKGCSLLMRTIANHCENMCQLKNSDHNNKQLLGAYTKLSSCGEKKEREENLNHFRNKWLKTILLVTETSLMALWELAPFQGQERPGQHSCVPGTSLASQVSQKSLQFAHSIVCFFFSTCKHTLSSLSLLTGEESISFMNFHRKKAPGQHWLAQAIM